MAGGSFNVPLTDTWKLLGNLAKLRTCGFAINEDDAGASALGADWSLWCEQEEVWCSWLVGMICGLTKHRLRHLLFYLVGPGLFAGLLHPAEEWQQQALTTLRGLWTGFQIASVKAFPGSPGGVQA